MNPDYTTHVEGDWPPPGTKKEDEEDAEDPVVVLFLDHAEIARRQGLLHILIT